MTWQEALDEAWRLVHENGWRYRVTYDGASWNVTRAGRRKQRSATATSQPRPGCS